MKSRRDILSRWDEPQVRRVSPAKRDAGSLDFDLLTRSQVALGNGAWSKVGLRDEPQVRRVSPAKRDDGKGLQPLVRKTRDS